MAPCSGLVRAQMNRMAGASPTSGSPEGGGGWRSRSTARFFQRPDVGVLAACCRYEDLLRGSEAGMTPPVRVSFITFSLPGSVAWATSGNVTGGYAMQVALRPQAARLLSVSLRSK